MGCGSSGEKGLHEELQAYKTENQELRGQEEEVERRLRSEQASAQSSQYDVSQFPRYSVAELHSELQVSEHESEESIQQLKSALRRTCDELERASREEQEEEALLRDQRAHRLNSPSSSSRAGPHRVAFADTAENHEEEMSAKRHQEESEELETKLGEMREQLASLQHEESQAVQGLRRAREQIRAEQEGRSDSANVASSLEQRLAESRQNHVRADQRWQDIERHLLEQKKELEMELKLQEEEQRHRERQLQEKDKELLEVNNQLADLQSLFDEVNQQLQTECGRIEQLQETVALCAKQGKELEALQDMLEESHRVLAQMRDALQHERAERVKAAQALEHEQQRTQLLLDVLKHFKEKLQGLTPQMLLSRLGADPKAKLASDSAVINGNNNATLKGHQVLSPRGKTTGGQEAASRGVASNVPTGTLAFASPRCAPSDGAASTIAPETSSYAPWIQSFGGSGAGFSGASGGRTPSPVPSRASPTHSFQSAVAPLAAAGPLSWQWASGQTIDQRQGHLGGHAVEPRQAVPSAASRPTHTSPRGPGSGPAPGEPHRTAGFSQPVSYGRWDAGNDVSKTLAEWSASVPLTRVDVVMANGHTGGSFGRQ